jgi:hypothetical protein
MHCAVNTAISKAIKLPKPPATKIAPVSFAYLIGSLKIPQVN